MKSVENITRMVEMISMKILVVQLEGSRHSEDRVVEGRTIFWILTVSGCNMWSEFVWLSNRFYRWFLLNQQWNLITVVENMRKHLSLKVDCAAQGHLTYTVRKISKRMLHSTQRIYWKMRWLHVPVLYRAHPSTEYTHVKMCRKYSSKIMSCNV